jgi:hypothetical protein
MYWSVVFAEENALDCEKAVIIHALARTKGNQSAAARLLGTTKRILTYKVHKYGIDCEQFNVNYKGELNAMKNYMKKIITAVLLLLIIAALPVTIWAEEQKPAAPEQTPAVKQAAPATTPEQKPAEQPPEEDKVTGEIDLSVLSAYIWRGYEQSRDSVVVQPAVTASYKGFSLNVWGNLDTRPYSAADAKYAANYTETDYTISYSKKFGILQVTPGYIYYGLGAPYAGGTAPLDSQELFLTLG